MSAWPLRWPEPIATWIARRRIEQASRVTLPWWGSLLHTQDRVAIQALLESAARIRAVLAQPGWQDIEAIFTDWIARYGEQAIQLGQVMEEDHGRLVLREKDTPEDDRRRLIVAAQAAALKGALAEVRQRAQADELLKRRDRREQAMVDNGELV